MMYSHQAKGLDGTGVDDDSSERLRSRLLARLGANYQTSLDGLSLGVRLASNLGSPGNSPHQTFDNLSTNAVAIDRAFVEYKAQERCFRSRRQAGKQGYPNWQQTELMWDEDIQPEGFAAGIERTLGKSRASAQVGFCYIVHNGWQKNIRSDDTIETWQLRYELDLQQVNSPPASTA
ncbi:MAG: hypothetical protein GY811_28575 [Myxococcales bacterium]|nr:hypothetical protein [Myxococcales bacterium]